MTAEIRHEPDRGRTELVTSRRLDRFCSSGAGASVAVDFVLTADGTTDERLLDHIVGLGRARAPERFWVAAPAA